MHDKIEERIISSPMGPEDEFEEFERNDSWGLVYNKIRLAAATNHDYSLKDARQPDYRSRNRYRDVSPYDHSRVVLQRDNLDYINASLVKVPQAGRAYILTQGPLPHTSGHFWLMVWEQKTRAVLMLNRIIEKGVVKCHQYFPCGLVNGGEDEMLFNDVDLRLKFVSVDQMGYYNVSTLEIEDTRTREKKQVLHFHYLTWPDFGVPDSPTEFLNFLMAVRKSGALEADVGPPVIHCSAGIGRSGTFCLVDTCLLLIERNQDTSCVNVYELLMGMRKYRMGLIQMPNQLRFSYLAIIEGAKSVVVNSPDSGVVQDFTPPESTPEHELVGNVVDNGSVPSESSCSSAKATMEKMVASCLHNSMHRDSDSSSGTEGGNFTSETTLTERTAEETQGTQRQESGEIRRRNREERRKKTEEQLAHMKRRQLEAEKWQGRRTTVQPYVYGFSVAALVVSYVAYQFYFSS
ncbi:Tyrosine-protein phosphatase non-receptor type 1 [Lamellibrachia satsuma]|nr:Tyrosine-protein phosphatase non-receptor type 1 [Lamellibrachia satsuma]